MKTTINDTVIARWYVGIDCHELIREPSGRHYVTTDGRVCDARSCHVTREEAREMWDAAAYHLGERP